MAIVKLHCFVGRASKTFDVPEPFRSQPHFIENAFRDGSNGVIDMELVNDAAGDSLVDDEARFVDALDLHRSALKLTHNVPGKGPVDRIALVIADRYAPRPGVFGVMFDEGFPTSDDPVRSKRYLETPREACAIFVGAINERRKGTREFNREIAFTAIHELGHIFNLGHVDVGKHSYMATSQPSKSYSNRWFSFLDDQRSWLSECDTNPSVKPGGSKYDPVSSFNKAARLIDDSTNSELVLEIGVPLTVFPSLYPVELDVELRIAKPTVRRRYVPDRLDPGYENFKIWLTLPNGERHLFRSLRSYCAPNRLVAVTHDKPMRRDISLFSSVQSSVFTHPGLYQIQADFLLGKRGRLLSNTVTVEVVTNSKFLSESESQMLADTRVRKFLYHRNLKCGHDVVDQLSEYLISERGSDMVSTSVRYSILRAFTNFRNKTGTPLYNKFDRFGIVFPRLLEDLRKFEAYLNRRQVFHLERLSAAIG